LLDAGPTASELELLRTVAARLGAKWGHDEFGWWATIEKSKISTREVWRQDDNGNKVMVASGLTEEQAQNRANELEATGHKQTYWIESNE